MSTLESLATTPFGSDSTAAEVVDGIDLTGKRANVTGSSSGIGVALGVAIVTTVAVTRTEDYLATNTGASGLVALTEGFQSAFMAMAILAAIGVALALLLLGRPRAQQEQLKLGGIGIDPLRLTP